MCLTGGAGDQRDRAPPGGHTGCRGKQRKVLSWKAVTDGTFQHNAQNLVLRCKLLDISMQLNSKNDNVQNLVLSCKLLDNSKQ